MTEKKTNDKSPALELHSSHADRPFIESVVVCVERSPDWEEFLRGQTISFLVGSTAGGGSDLTARFVARHFERYIPGKPRIDIINKPGAGGMIAMNELYNLRKPDGLSFVVINTSALFATAGGNEAIRFDLRKFIWIGQAFDDAQTLYVRSATPYTSFEAIKSQQRRQAAKNGRTVPRPH